jgi:hypothetical protein
MELTGATNGDTIYINQNGYQGTRNTSVYEVSAGYSAELVCQLAGAGSYSFTYNSSKTYTIRIVWVTGVSASDFLNVSVGQNAIVPIPNGTTDATIYETYFVKFNSIPNGFPSGAGIYTYATGSTPFGTTYLLNGSYSDTQLLNGVYVNARRAYFDVAIGSAVLTEWGPTLYGRSSFCNYTPIPNNLPQPTAVPFTPTPTPTLTPTRTGTPTPTPTLTATSSGTPTPTPSYIP